MPKESKETQGTKDDGRDASRGPEGGVRSVRQLTRRVLRVARTRYASRRIGHRREAGDYPIRGNPSFFALGSSVANRRMKPRVAK